MKLKKNVFFSISISAVTKLFRVKKMEVTVNQFELELPDNEEW